MTPTYTISILYTLHARSSIWLVQLDGNIYIPVNLSFYFRIQKYFIYCSFLHLHCKISM